MLLTLIIFIIVLGILVFVHEFGHFIAAKKAGVRVFEFGFGFPPRIFGIQRINNERKGKRWRIIKGSKNIKDNDNTNTVYSLNWLPIGGFVNIKGQDGENPNDKDSLVNKSWPWRALVLAAGVIMNFILCAILIAIGFMIGLPQAIEGPPAKADVRDRKIQIISILDDSPAKEAGLQMGDSIKAIDGRKIETIIDVQKITETKVDQPISLNIVRAGEEMIQEITPIVLERTSKSGIGVGLIESGIVSYPIHIALWKGIETTGLLTKAIVFAFGSIIKDLVVIKKVTVEVAGPVGIAVMTGQFARMGFIYLLQFTALLSINLAIINILPIPALDGGHLVFLLVEKIRRKALNQKVEAIINQIFFLALILLIFAVTIKDVSRFSDKFINLWENIKNIF